MTLQNSDWEKKLQVRKGNVGERIVIKFLESKGLICYRAITEGPHAFDFLVMKSKEEILIAEVKSKAKMNYFPATGINTKHYEEYKKISEKHNLKIFLFFVDEHPEERRVYGNYISELNKEVVIGSKKYPMQINSGKITLFPIASMIEIQKLTNEEVEELRLLSSRSHEYGISAKAA